MNTIKKYKYEIIIFVVDAICMILELIASRILSPYFGSSNIVWTSVIGIILLSSSIGNYLGGIIADKEEKENSLKLILALVAILIFVIPFSERMTLKILAKYITNFKLGAILATILIFFMPSLGLGIINPLIIRLKLEDIENAGKTTGKINAIATLGGIVGTFLGGFILLPWLGSINNLFVLTISLVLLIPIVNMKLKDKVNIFVSIAILVSCLSIYYFRAANNVYSESIINDEDLVELSYDTQYGRVIIRNMYTQDTNEPVRLLSIDSGFESATYTDEAKRYELVFEYTKAYDLMFKANIDVKNTLLIGGAGYSYPKYYISHYPDKNIDVVEIDGDITKIAKKYFYLDQLIRDYNLDENKRLSLITDDGRMYLNSNTKKYDAILNDAFSGSSPAKTLTTIEHIQNIKKSLNEGGVYLTNIISSLEGNDSKFLRAEVNTLKKVFKNVYVVPCNYKDELTSIQNSMVICSDQDINLENAYDLNLASDEIVLTDDNCPVDTLLPNIK